MTTGPLGQGLATAVGMVMASRKRRGLFDADAPVGRSVFDHTVWVVASGGDLREGVTGEASSLAGHQRRGNLVVVYDDNHISTEGDTDSAFGEDVLARYEAYGWHTQRVRDVNDVAALYGALSAAREKSGRPSIIAVESVIAWPAPNARGTAKAHGGPLGSEEVAAAKRLLGLPEDRTFHIPDDVVRHMRRRAERQREARAEWDVRYEKWRAGHPEAARGGYVLVESSAATPRGILIGTGSEVQLAVRAAGALEAEGVATRVVSMPCGEWFAEQDPAYRRHVLPPQVAARVSVEAGIALGRREFVGGYGEIVALSDYGASAPYEVLYEKFGLTVDRGVDAARTSLTRAEAVHVGS